MEVLRITLKILRVLPLSVHVSSCYRDESASATYYFRHKTESQQASRNDGLVKEWMYYRPLQHGESEFPLRNKQVGDYFHTLCIYIINPLLYSLASESIAAALNIIPPL